MSQVDFRGAIVDKVTLSGGDDGKLKVMCGLKVHWTEALASQLGLVADGEDWTNPPAKCKSMGLRGTLDGVNMIVTPNKPELAEYALDVKIGDVTSFKYAADYDEEAEQVKNRRLTFNVAIAEDDVYVKLAMLIEKTHAGQLTSDCKLVYNDPQEPEDDKQAVIPGTEPKKRGRPKKVQSIAEQAPEAETVAAE